MKNESRTKNHSRRSDSADGAPPELPKDYGVLHANPMEAAEDIDFLKANEQRVSAGLVRGRSGYRRGLEIGFQGLSIFPVRLVQTTAKRSAKMGSTYWIPSSSVSPRTSQIVRSHRRSGEKAGVTFAQFVMMTPFLAQSILRLEKEQAAEPRT